MTTAKSIQYDQPGSAASGYGITPDNAIAKLEKLYKDYKVKGITSGGNEGIYNALTAYLGKRDGPSWDPIAKGLKTGDFSGVKNLNAAKIAGF